MIERKAWGKETKYHAPEVVFLSRGDASFLIQMRLQICKYLSENAWKFSELLRRVGRYVATHSLKGFSNMNLLAVRLKRRYIYIYHATRRHTPENDCLW